MTSRRTATNKVLTFDEVAELAAAWPGVERGTAYGSPALKVGGKMFTCIPTNRAAEPDSLAVRVDFDDRDELIASEPRTFYLKPHYADYAVVLVRLARIDREALRDLLHMSWKFMSAGKPRVRHAKKR